MKMYLEEYIRLTDDSLHKLEVIQSALSEEKTKKQLVEGGLDIMFGHDLEDLWEGGELSAEGLENGLSYLEDYLAEKVRGRIEKIEK